MRDCTHGQLARSCNICEMEQEIERLIDLLRLSRDVIYYGAFPIGWNIDRLDEEIRSRREALATTPEESK